LSEVKTNHKPRVLPSWDLGTWPVAARLAWPPPRRPLQPCAPAPGPCRPANPLPLAFATLRPCSLRWPRMSRSAGRSPLLAARRPSCPVSVQAEAEGRGGVGASGARGGSEARKEGVECLSGPSGPSWEGGSLEARLKGRVFY